jgi:hypothetical protein
MHTLLGHTEYTRKKHKWKTQCRVCLNPQAYTQYSNQVYKQILQIGPVWRQWAVDKEHKECIIYCMLETILSFALYLALCYAIPVLLLVLMNGEQPNSREADAVSPGLRSSKRHA